MNKIRKIYITDIYLTNFEGHYFAEATALHDASEKLGFDARIVGNPKIDKATAQKHNILPIGPAFASPTQLYFNYLWKKKSGKNLFSKLKLDKTPIFSFLTKRWLEKPVDVFLQQLPKEADSLYLFQTSSFFVISSILNGLLRNKLDLQIAFSMHVQMSEAEISETNRILEELSLTVAPKFFNSSEIYVEEYHKNGFTSMSLLPIPQPGWSKYLSVSNTKKQDITLSFIGNSTYRKGFHLLPELVKKIRNEFPGQKFQFNIQYSSSQNFNRHGLVIKSAYNKLKKLKVNLITEALNNKAYYELLNNSDIILLPYQLSDLYPCYKTGGTSGIVLEAMARGKIPVVPADTWLSMQVEKFNNGKIFSGNDDFFTQTIAAINEFESLKKTAEANKEYWSKKHCPEQVIRTIIY